jgi:pyridoxine kinase
MRIPRAACINDISGFGRCSLTTALAVLPAAGVQACPVPTAVLSKHTGFPSFYFKDMTSSMTPYLRDWDKLEFDGIYSGFLGSSDQIRIVEEFILNRKKKNPDINVIIDPVMGDGGRLYSTYTSEMHRRMKKLAACADLITPNITEACFLTGDEYSGEEISDSFAKELAYRLEDMGVGRIVLTGIARAENIVNMTYDSNEFYFDYVHRESRIYSGTGDIFASVVTAFLLKGKPLAEAVQIAGDFISKSIEYTVTAGAPLQEGVVFEPILHYLSSYFR